MLLQIQANGFVGRKLKLVIHVLNGAPLSSEHSIMPEDELGVAGHIFTIDYTPGAPETILSQAHVIEADLVETRKKHSLMELAGLDTDGERVKRKRPSKAPEVTP